ncbi:glycosyl hydrolase family 28-related protein [Rossellomorea aquimaris]|uniref:glycosyl hydrolase family 28-related protein n=1 Tax=Rossellomorea aquimaris TaxID=189382 RepID=UPI001CFC8491|nr:right-handed parallel beta-helix repeat-containing protein [Rossellomorea aquimaris]
MKKGLIAIAMLILCVAGTSNDTAANNGMINVKAYGAVGDGKTDDTTAIKKALYYGKNRTVFFPEGTYLVTDTVTVKMNTEVYGDDAIIKGDRPGDTMFRIYGENIHVHDLTIDGGRTFLRGMTVMNGTSNLNVKNVKLTRFSQPDDSPLSTSTPIAIRVEGGVQDVLFDRLTIRDVFAKYISSNVGWNHKVSRGILISPALSTQPVSRNITIQNSLISEIGPKDDGDGIVVQGFQDDVGVTIQHNTFERNHKRAIKIQSPGVTIAHNKIHNNFYQDNVYDTYKETNEYDMWSGISVYHDNVEITENTIDGIGRYSAAIDIAGGNHVLISRNTIANREDSPGSDLIRINKGYDGTSSFSNISIQDNSLRNGRYGINVVAGVELLTLSGNTYDGVERLASSGIEAR